MDSPDHEDRQDCTAREVVERFGQFMRAIHVVRGSHSSPWAECALTIQQLHALSLLAARTEGLIGRELAAGLGVGPSAITPLVDRLAEHGYLTRREDRDDRRATRLIVTERGLGMLQRLATGKGDLMLDVLARLSQPELDTVGTAFQLLLGAVGEILAEQPNSASFAPQPVHAPS